MGTRRRVSRAFKALVALVLVGGALATGLVFTSIRANAIDAQRAAFFDAVQFGTAAEAKVFLDRGWSAIERERLSEPSRPFFQQLTLLWNRGLQPSLGKSVLEAAVANRRERTAMIQLALDSGARLNEPPNDGSLVNFAVSTGDVEAVRLLLNRGATLAGGEVPVGIALWRPNPDMVRVLVEQGARPPVNWRDYLKTWAPGKGAEREQVVVLLKRISP